MPSFNWRLALQSGYTPEEIQAHLDKRGLSDEALIERQLGGKPMLPYSYGSPTSLTPAEEAQFQSWAKQNKVRLDPGWNEDYDMRGLWKANPFAGPDERGHWPDTYKLPNHPTFSQESIYATPDAPRWYGRRLIDSQGRLVADETSSPLDLPPLPPPALPIRLSDLAKKRK